ncbi:MULTISPECIES: helix-turn-helix domain-containing protein [Phaeobacter]|jgi:transcriptional regulator with XRE-family HTH domain|uniref:helix-turn-helix domain-containing protein n=1 Tax=Phaeobacter TaxID=302485 RepID=UPI00237F2178|nr:XRE family transcriptional regulator [Phaeobacter gallaeciensis]MDE4139663.1 short-chain fatty acyl-CoA regulator family protein [Phaeobacter gallaeciensis]MDE4147279.1 short-chain fatty acyl-CoA regulator family protein [Phaeobacter gallaeciensis]MDE4151498.1 short-chain fatty acyl-CoA regulator family protein [Phaeobacter gallaeciensis]MDE4227718.1 short-chain fatty acyl-CoA regulator family protein [Phaeobacter gallaeciensis]MDE4255962.1 short-chain fatty acyl-CoA regulator family protei
MARDTLTGSRIRERRLILGMRQAELARAAGISASYLNLIEHNRRRIGGKLLVGIAQVLGVEPSMLSEGAEAALIASLREAAADSGVPVAELDRADEFAGRFPGWAEVLATSHRRIATLERTVQTLSDRLTHDPHLAASLHEVLSTAAAIRSTASILAETNELEPEWSDRFHKNLNEDSLRLAESSRALVSFLDESNTGADRRGVPHEEAEAFFLAQGYHFPDLETGSGSPEELVSGAPELVSDAARLIARGALEQYQRDAAALPLEPLRVALDKGGIRPGALAEQFGCDLPTVLRRIGLLPFEVLGQEAGLVICDASGSILVRKPVTGFALPRFGASCPLWPIYTALARPHVPVRRNVVQQGRSALAFKCLAVAWDHVTPDFDSDPLYHAVMLILPQSEVPEGAQPVGASCRICPRRGCPARREPSILKEEF